jgi:hypothetical protein
MIFNVGLENGLDGRSLAWVLDYPGCFAYGEDGPSAVINVPRAFLDYRSWISKHTPDSWLKDLADFDVRLVEVYEVFHFDEHYNQVKDGNSIESWFRNDWKPLTALEVRRGLQLLEWARQDLLFVVEDLSDAQLNEKRPEERWSINGILRHVGGAEWFYMDCLGLAGMNRGQLPDEPRARLELVRARLNQVLPDLAGTERVLGIDGEFWSPRKMLRRALWHEMDHIDHIKKLIM